jgi:acetoin utilization deacetylase AcuC-like enzyme
MSRDVLLYFNERMIDHNPGRDHPESPERLRSIRQSLLESPIPGTRWLDGRAASVKECAQVHHQSHVDLIEQSRGKHARLDADTVLSPASVDAAYLSVGAGIQAVDSLVDGGSNRCFVLARPPGHHAEADRAMGFCLFNNIAIAAAHAIKRGCQRVMIIDWDVHHGNGSQHSFYDRNDVLVFNTHQFPFYPGTGRASEIGERDGQGFTINCPMPAQLGDGDFQKIYSELLIPVAEAYKPDLVLVSAGFDGHRRDPLGAMNVSDEGYAHLCGLVCEIADRYADGRLALFLEGGYDLQGLTGSVRSCIEVLTGSTPPESSEAATKGGIRALQIARECQDSFWTLA